MQPYVDRRARLVAAMRARGGGVAVLFTAPEVLRNGNSPYAYRWDSNFYYLSGFPEPEAALALVVGPEQTETVLFCREKDEEREIWDGVRFGTAAAREHFGVDRALPIGTVDAELPRLLENAPTLFYALGSDERLDARVRQWLTAVRAQVRALVCAPPQSVDLAAMIAEMRLIKDEHELRTMRRGGQINASAHQRAMRATRPGMHEYEIEAELLHEYTRCGSPAPAYGSIVAGGSNACILHYRANRDVLRDGDLLLIDAGCELDGYASDITRTFPVNGRFSAAQRELYDIVLAAQHAAIAAVRPGARFIDPHEAAVRVIAAGLIELGLIAGPLEEAIAQGSYRRFFMHRTGHWLGMDVHDCGNYREPGEATTGGVPPSRVLRTGMVFTVEPGLYVRAAPDVPARYHDIGIRIEDDVVVTENGCEVLTGGVPKDPDAIETLMRG